MKVFLTGGSGRVGQDTIPQLVAAGHSVTALARSDSSVEKLRSLGATPVKGATTDLDVLGQAASEADAVIHLAFNHALAFKGQAAQALLEDRNAITSICEALSKTGDGKKTFICTSGALGRTDENDTAELPHVERSKSETLTHSFAAKGVRTIVVRLPPVTHSPSEPHAFIAPQIDAARKNGSAAYVGAGDAVWSACHAKDAGALYVKALSKGESGATYHAVAESAIPTKKLAEFIAKKLNVPTRSADSKTLMGEGYGYVGMMLGIGGPSSSEITKKALDWNPKEPGLFEALETDYVW